MNRLVAAELVHDGQSRGRVAGNRVLGLGLLAVAVMLSGCTQLGPSLVRAGRNEYNVAVAQTNDEQTVLNLVRFRYADNPLYLQVDSVTTQFNFRQGADADLTRDADVQRYGWRIGADVRYSETPTISYTPVTGQQFVRNIITPMSFETFILLANTGISIDRLLRLTASRMNGLQNAPEAEGPTPAEVPDYVEFAPAAALLRELQKKDALRFRFRDPGTDTIPAMFIRPDALEWPETRELRSLLGLEVTKRFYDVHIIADKPSRDSIGIELRSLNRMAHFLSTAVEVPARDEEAGRVMITKDQNGQRFDWSQVMDGLFRVRSQAERPTDAAVAVRYRGAWFYIDDRVMDSKYTFRLMEQVGSILAGEIEKGPAPVITLPVGGG